MTTRTNDRLVVMLSDALRQKQEKLTDLQSAFLKYGEHSLSCQQAETPHCVCGFDSVRKIVRAY